MERLTGKTRNFDGTGFAMEAIIDDKGHLNDFADKVLTKLAEYEDAEEQGLLLRLQFPIGQKVYFIYASAIDDTLMICSMKYQYSCLDFPRVYYATREEAEKALEDMKGGVE